MSRLANAKVWVARRFFGEFFDETSPLNASKLTDAAARELSTGTVKRLGLRYGDSTSGEYEEAEFDLSPINDGYNADSYIRQGVDKYVDQIFKEGFQFFGKDSSVVEYINMRFNYMAEATGIPTEQLFIEIAEDVVKYGNSIVVKARAKDANSLPQGMTVTGLNGTQPIAGYYPLNATTMTVLRDKNGTVKSWQQSVDDADPITFKSADVVHIYYKREKGNAFGTPFLIPVLDDVRALRQAEENVLKMMYRNIYPFYHVAVGDNEAPGSEAEIAEVEGALNDMDVDGGIVTTSRVTIKPVASNQVIDAHPYLSYLEERVFSGMGIPGILFGRGGTANRSTGDNMTSEMSDRIHAIQRTIEVFVNQFIVKEILMEGGYDPVLSPDQEVLFKFNENDLDSRVKREIHAVYLYEHNSITEDEMRKEIGLDPITDRAKMHQALITQANATFNANLSATNNTSSSSSSEEDTKSAETDNKQKPTNQSGTKTSPKKNTNSVQTMQGLLLDQANLLRDELATYQATHDANTRQVDVMLHKLEYHRQECLAIVDELSDNTRQAGTRKGNITRWFKQTATSLEDVAHEAMCETLAKDLVDELVCKFERSADRGGSE